MSDREIARRAAVERVRAAMRAKLPPPLPGQGDVMQTEAEGLKPFSFLRAALEERRSVGIERYGVPLQIGNGRDFLIDAAQEAVDLVAYLRGAEMAAQARYAETEEEADGVRCDEIQYIRIEAENIAEDLLWVAVKDPT